MARKKFSDGNIRMIYDHGICLETRTIFMENLNFDSEGEEVGIDSKMFQQVLKSLYVLNELDSKEPIKIKMNNPGGCIFNGYAIYDAIASSPSPVDIEVYGQATSMGAIILQAGRQRLIHPNAIIMIHDGYNQDKERMPMRSCENWAEFSKWDRRRMYRLFAERSGQNYTYWAKKCVNDTIYTAPQAIKEGLADRIIEVADWRKNISKSSF